MSSPKADFLAGVRDVSPLLLGAIPFGLVVGVALVAAGIPAIHAIAMSASIFGGAAQLAAAELVGNGAPAVLVVAVALVVNLRFMMYSASIAPHFRRLATRWKWLLSAFLVDMNYAVSITRFTDDESVDRRWYYLGTSLPLWTAWITTTAIGVVVGTRVPPGLHLDFAVPLVFVALAVQAVEDRATAAAAVAAGLLAVPGIALPLESGLLVAAIGGVAVGMALEGRVA
jgi:4-azaleucine resistance transporter AzlC